MKSNKKSLSTQKDTPATRKKRMQARLQEITAKGEQELAAVMQSIDKVKSSFSKDRQ